MTGVQTCALPISLAVKDEGGSPLRPQRVTAAPPRLAQARRRLLVPVLPDVGGPLAVAEDGGELGAQSPLAGRPGLLGQPRLRPWLQCSHDAGVTQECPDLPPAHAAALSGGPRPTAPLEVRPQGPSPPRPWGSPAWVSSAHESPEGSREGLRTPHPLSPRLLLKIGRASCRERVSSPV